MLDDQRYTSLSTTHAHITQAPRPRKTSRGLVGTSAEAPAADLSTDPAPQHRAAPVPPTYEPIAQQRLNLPAPQPPPSALDLPPQAEIEAAVAVYFARHYQVGFLHR